MQAAYRLHLASFAQVLVQPALSCRFQFHDVPGLAHLTQRQSFLPAEYRLLVNTLFPETYHQDAQRHLALAQLQNPNLSM